MTALNSLIYGEHKSDLFTPKTLLNRVNIGYKGKTYLLLEGKDDILALKRIYDKEKCVPCIVEGRPRVFECLIEINKHKINDSKIDFVKGLVDWDYEKILGDRNGDSKTPNIIKSYLFYTDYHDINIVVAASKAFVKMVHSLCPNKFQNKDKEILKIRKDAIKITKKIGLVRCYSSDKKYPEKFNFKENIEDLEKYIDKKNKTLKLLELLTDLDNEKKFSERKKEKLRDFIEKDYPMELQKLYDRKDRVWHLCRGHDLFLILYFLLIDRQEFQGISFDKFNETLLDNFQLEDFLEQNLYKQVKEWEEKMKGKGKNYKFFFDSNKNPDKINAFYCSDAKSSFHDNT
jgi:hypothetical protein